LVLDIIKVIRKGDVVLVTVIPAELPYRYMSKVTRKLNKLYTAARDSSSVVMEAPICLIKGISFPMKKDEGQLQWSLTVLSRTDVQISYGGNIHEVGLV